MDYEPLFDKLSVTIWLVLGIAFTAGLLCGGLSLWLWAH